MGFIIHFYIIFGTNLLTGGPAQIAVFFCLFQCFEGKEYQTESKRNETFGNVIFRTNVIQRTWSGRQAINKEAMRQGGAPAPWVRPHPRGPLAALLTNLFRLYILIYPGNIRTGAKTLFPPPQPSVTKRSHLGASLMMCEQFTIDLRVHSYQLDGFFSLFGSQYKFLLDSLGDLFDVIFFCGVFVEIR